MKKQLILKTIFLVAFTFIAFQVLIIPAYLERHSRQSKVNIQPVSVYSRFLTLYSTLNIPLILLEVDLLNSTEDVRIHHVLDKRKHLTYALLKEEKPNVSLDKFKLHFETIGLKFFATKSFNKEIGTSVTSHYFLCSTDLTVHIVVFYPRASRSLWHGDVDRSTEPRDKCDIRTDSFVRYPGLYDKFTFVKRGNILFPSPGSEFITAVGRSQFIECNYTRAAEFNARHPPDSSHESLKFHRKARQIIARAKQYLDDLGIPFWLSSGTCLGWFRQCDIITYSKDVDFGIWIEDYKPELISTFEKGGFYLKNVFGKISDSYELSFQAGDIKLDLFFFYTEEDHMWNGGTHHETGQKYKYIFPKFSMCWTLFLELKVQVPCPPQPYIEANYGTNWWEPVREWEWNKSPPNVIENGFWPKEEWEQVIQIY